MSKGGDEAPPPNLVGQDEMFTVRRLEGQPAYKGLADGLTFRQTQGLRFVAIELDFTSNDWPPFSRRVFVGDPDNNAWAPVPQDWEEQWAADGLDPRLETFAPAPFKLERGPYFILRRVETLTPEYWLIKEAIGIRDVLDASSHDDALAAAHALGSLRQQAHLHGLHLKALKVGQACISGGQKGGKATRGIKSTETRARLQEMDAIIGRSRPVSEAANIVARRRGVKAAAIRILYYRHRRQAE